MPASPIYPIVGVNFSRVDTTQKHALGLELDANDGTRRKYIRAGAAIAIYSALTQDFAEGVFDYHPTSAADTPLLGIAPVALADNEFGWVIVNGPGNVKVAATPGSAGAQLVTTGTAGTLDDTAAAAANALAAGSGKGCLLVADDTPSAGVASVVLY